MKNVGNILTILFTIFVPVLAILFITGMPAIAKIALICVYAFSLYSLLKYYVLGKIMVFNGYYYWYLKRILSQKKYRLVINLLSLQALVRLQHKISSKEYQQVIQLFPEDVQEELAEFKHGQSQSIFPFSHMNLSAK